MLSGWGSKQRTKTYRLAASYAIFASVGSFGAPPSLGRHSWNCVIGTASRHTASSSRPSSTGCWLACTARTLLGAAAAESAATWTGARSGDCTARVTAAKSGAANSMADPGVVSWLDDGTPEKVVSDDDVAECYSPCLAKSSPGWSRVTRNAGRLVTSAVTTSMRIETSSRPVVSRVPTPGTMDESGPAAR